MWHRERMRFVVEHRPNETCVEARDGRRIGYEARGCIERAKNEREEDLPFMEVASINVRRDRLRRGIGTKLYERLARMSCETYALPLTSSDADYRSVYSDGFWRKQRAKGRATCIDSDGISNPGRGLLCWRYVLPCPAPKSLAGARRSRT